MEIEKNTIENRTDKDWDIYEAWLYGMDGIGRKKMKRFERSGLSFEEIYHLPPKGLHNLMEKLYKASDSSSRAWPDKILEKDFETILQGQKNSNPITLYENMCRQNIYYVNYNANGFPSRLREIPDAPYALYRKGQAFDEKERRPVLAIVGARLCSEYGKYVARELGEMAAQLGFVVVSGLASGVDGIAQNAARMADGEVTAVLGCGVDICYPKENRNIYEGIQKKGRLISEYPPGTKPLAQNFPPRNRMIAGLSDAVIVVEAKKRSGTLITVDMALEQGREVYVIPGRITDPMSYGCNRLIAQGAEGIVDMIETLLEIRDKSLHNIERSEHMEHNEHKEDDQKDRRAEPEIRQNVIPASEKCNKQCREISGNGGPEKRRMENRKAEKEEQTYAYSDRKPEQEVETLIRNSIEVKGKTVQEIFESVKEKTGITLPKLQEKLLQMELLGQISEVGGYYQIRI